MNLLIFLFKISKAIFYQKRSKNRLFVEHYFLLNRFMNVPHAASAKHSKFLSSILCLAAL